MSEPKEVRFHPPTARSCLTLARVVQQTRFIQGDLNGAAAIKQACTLIEKSFGVSTDSPPAGQALAKFRHWVQACSALINGLQFSSDERLRTGLGLLHLALEHHEGICELMTLGLAGPAFALYRPFYDAALRGTWILYSASDEAISAFHKVEKIPDHYKMVCDLEKIPALADSLFGTFHRGIYKRLHAFTHGGPVQVHARSTPTEITSDYSEAGMVWLMGGVATLGCMTAGILCEFTQPERGVELLESYISIYGNPTAQGEDGSLL